MCTDRHWRTTEYLNIAEPTATLVVAELICVFYGNELYSISLDCVRRKVKVR
jgi:hypothetical protein